MKEDEKISALIGDIYDTVIDPATWPDVLRRTASFVGGQAAGLIARDTVNRSADASYSVGVDPHYLQLYLDQDARLDPTPTSFYFFDIGEVVCTVDLMPYEEFQETRFFQEWARPQGWVDSVQAILEKSNTSFAHLSFLRNEVTGLADEGTRRRMQLIVPHVRRAVLIGKVIDLKTAEAASFADSLDGLSAGVFLIDARGRIVHANASGHDLLADGAVLKAIDGKIVAGDPSAEQALCDVFLSANSGDAAIGNKGVAVAMTARNGEPYVAHLLPLTSGARRGAGAPYSAVAALFVRRAALNIPSPPEVIARTYNLTPTELRVLMATVEVGGVPEVAEALGVAETTVRFHLRRLFEKTGTHRQADLVKLVASFSNPLIR